MTNNLHQGLSLWGIPQIGKLTAACKQRVYITWDCLDCPKVGIAVEGKQHALQKPQVSLLMENFFVLNCHAEKSAHLVNTIGLSERQGHTQYMGKRGLQHHNSSFINFLRQVPKNQQKACNCSWKIQDCLMLVTPLQSKNICTAIWRRGLVVNTNKQLALWTLPLLGKHWHREFISN